ncbi:triokinase/FMN cyclase-like [Eriocheir sinensis]|uniref:triokinase/FMN cyclase-like n=1 Tax=Eriocheir sinensis TaxID=95602 RepID=UPI0021C870B6|nr:triokinase/FMN cyclase-like [Eriocheir sinensis]XP_050731640.1 triokinase/FMN cyclase-like [Eriocheir sinensis]XP_050731641.1 triokinase/FMN cyclase-like [Eriocheir sinensis]XP_050731642.1 triokinase/FMN cyclase-like [Eriocheir sinensis]
MSEGQLYTSSETCVDEGLEGVVAANPGFVLLPEQRVVVERGRLLEGAGRTRGVALVSGGGSGHEPFPVGFVGSGMLSAAVAGHVFVSPPAANVTAAITAVGKDNPDGVLVIVFNYTGDRINFGMAVERCRAAGMKVEMYVSGDDSALTKLEGTAGRRGLCGTHFVFKIVGALVERGCSLAEALDTCRKLGEATGTIGVAASGCTLPGASAPLFTVARGHLELGLGVHGETGAATIPAGSPREVVAALLDQLTRRDSASRLDLQAGDEVAVIINNLGCLTLLELSSVTKEVVAQLKSRGVRPVRVYPSPVMTSLDMRGFHVSVLRLRDPSWLALLDAPTSAPAWPAPCLAAAHAEDQVKFPDLNLTFSHEKIEGGYKLEEAAHVQTLRRCLEAVVSRMPQHEKSLNALDAECGDGDCGSTFLQGVAGLSKKLPTLKMSHPGQVLTVLGEVAETNMGGSSGGIYSIFCTAAAATMAAPRDSHRRTWAAALRAGAEAISKYGGASTGDRTLLDALVPAVEALEAASDGDDLKSLLKAMAAAADEGARRTAGMKARAGRATYVRDEKVHGEDAGARCLAWLLEALCHN